MLKNDFSAPQKIENENSNKAQSLKQLIGGTLLVSALSLAGQQDAEAGIINITGEGFVNQDNALYAEGTPVSFSLDYDDSYLDTNPSDDIGVYDGSIFSYQIQIGDDSYDVNVNMGQNVIGIFDNDDINFPNSASFIVSNTQTQESIDFASTLALLDTTQMEFTSDDLIDLVDYSNFTSSSLNMQINSQNVFASIDTNSVQFTEHNDAKPVNEPHSLLLLGIGLLGMAGLGRKRSLNNDTENNQALEV